jgi:hypothetical protein
VSSYGIISAISISVALLLATSCQGPYNTPGASLPIAPEGLTCASAADGKSIGLSWSAVEKVSSYCVYRADAGSETFRKLATISTTSYTDSTTTPGSSYSYALSSVNSAGEGSKGKAVSCAASKPQEGSGAVPPAPAGLACTSAADGNSVSLSWSAPKGADGYIVYRAASGSSSFKELGRPTSAGYKDETTSPGTAYDYAVSALNASGESQKSAVAAVTASVLLLNGKYAGIPYSKVSDSSSQGPYSFTFDAAGNYSKAFGSAAPDESGIYTYTPSSRSLLLDFYSATYGTEYYFTYSPVFVGFDGKICLDLYTFTPETGKDFPIGVFSKNIIERDIQGSTGVGGAGTGLKSGSTWKMSLTFTSDMKYKNSRVCSSDGYSSSPDAIDECSMFSSGTWTYSSSTSDMVLTNWNGAYNRAVTVKSLNLDGKTYYYFSSAVYSK